MKRGIYLSKILAFIYDEMADFELTFATYVAGRWMEKELVTIAYENKVVVSKSGVRYLPHITIEEALDLDDIDGIIIPGGWNDETRPELHELLNKLNDDNKFLAAICAGPLYLAKAGVLDNKKFTTTLTKEFLIEEKKDDPFNWDNYEDKNVIRDGNIITAIGNAFIDFGMEIFDYYKVFDDPEFGITKEELAKEYKGL